MKASEKKKSSGGRKWKKPREKAAKKEQKKSPTYDTPIGVEPDESQHRAGSSEHHDDE